MLWVIQIQSFRWILIAISVVLSSAVLIGSLWSAFKNDPNRLVKLLLKKNMQIQVFFGVIAGIILFHTLLAVGFKVK